MKNNVVRKRSIAMSAAILCGLLGSPGYAQEESNAAKASASHQQIITTKPTTMEIGMPARPVPAGVLSAMRQVAAKSGATKVYWFWVSISGDRPHLGFAVSPRTPVIVANLGKGIEPIWTKQRPDNHVFDILPLDSVAAQLKGTKAQLLYEAKSK